MPVSPSDGDVANRSNSVAAMSGAIPGPSSTTSTHTASAAAVVGAEAALRRAVIALVDNAIRHAHSEVRVTTTAAADAVCVVVVDDGPGIAPDMAATLFDRFATSPSDGLTGTRRRYGIGLALVSEIAAWHGGSVAIVETVGSGASLRLRIPVRRR